MRHPFKIIAAAAALAGAAIGAAPAAANIPLGLRQAPPVEVQSIAFRRTRYGPGVYACGGGRYYRFLGGWGCDFYRYPGYDVPRR
jgi:hypothetical protein